MSDDPGTDPFTSVSALREANRPLLDRLHEHDEDDLPEDYLAQIEHFQARAAATGTILSAVEDRSEAQSIINFWLTILYNGGRKPPTIKLAAFDSAAARLRSGDAPPYKGLEPFQVEDSASFFGRHNTVRDMLNRLAEHRLLAITGLSGSGKSSVVRAGLIPRLRDGAAPGSSEWLILDPLVPGARPVAAFGELAPVLGRELARIEQAGDLVAALDRTGRAVVLSVDQFEELFTLCESAEERNLFLDSLVAAATTGEHRHIVLVTMRSEYDGKVETHPAFAELFKHGRIQIGALTALELRTAIEQPAAQVGVGFEPTLVDELVQRVLGEPAGLPLLQFTLLELWKRRSAENRLTHKAYDDLGGSPREILTRRADQVYDSFQTKEDQVLSRRIFLALVKIGEGLQPTSRRTVRSALDRLGPRDNLDRVLAIWSAHGLIRLMPPGEVGPASNVEVAHEALIRNWGRLDEWTQDEFAFTRRRRVLTERASAWKDGHDTLLAPLSLQEAEQYEDLSELEEEYVAASHHGVEQATIRRRRLLQFAWAAGVVGAALLLWGSSVSFIALVQKFEAAKTTADANRYREEAKKAVAAATEAKFDEDLAAASAGIQRARAIEEAAKARASLKKLTAARQLLLRAEAIRTRAVRAADMRVRAQLAGEMFALQEEIEKRRRELGDVQGKLGTAQVTIRDANTRLREFGRIQNEERPMIVLSEFREGRVPPLWDQLRDERSMIERVARSVGHLAATGRNRNYVSTVFVVAEGVVMAPAWGELALDRLNEWRLTFSDDISSTPSGHFTIESVIGVIQGMTPDKSLLLLRVKTPNEGGSALPPPLTLARVRKDQPKSPGLGSAPGLAGELEPGMQLYLIGYPFTHADIPEEIRSSLSGSTQLKRVQPGFLLDWEADGNGLQLRYDASSYGGNGGSPVIDFQTGRVIGIHWGGGKALGKFGIALTDAILNSPAAKKAKLRAEAAGAR